MERLINIIYTPQRSDIKAEYSAINDILTIKIGEIEEIFDFTNLDEGKAEEIIVEKLPINPIISAEKIGDTTDITVIRFYGEREKELFENVTDKMEN